eukprot:CAMPEP_0197190752 /NCGR_PEP_ID=MMETSP1423-20130617/22245_1 /TAXON_ID=476441 /ORGANISM="Pseudo-nitzschia heimii, Strain UNC1101" /LENGTH=268 /DNA_ID=CAMNT_0042643209 /DNA_START=39 /DNA_END=845 /DNA_ORIENTATION=+
MSTKVESNLSAAVQVGHWVASILASAIHQSVGSNGPLLIAGTLLACLVGAIACRKLAGTGGAKSAAACRRPEAEIAETVTTPVDDSAALLAISKKTTEPIDEDDDDNSFASLGLVSTHDIESDDESNDEHDSNEEEEEECNQPSPTQTDDFLRETFDNVEGADSEDDWNEFEYNQQFDDSKPAQPQPMPPPPPPKATSSKKESLSQMRKRVAREMKEAEDRRRQRSASGSSAVATTAPAAPVRRSVRKESIKEMKARVARDFAAKLQR